MSEQWFWSNEPKKVIAMIDQKKEIDIEKLKLSGLLTACSIWGKKPDDFIKEEEVAGIDKPVDPQLLKGWY